mmetsp:Transcript_9991/g.33924  ORF Transcript_9991/g.33924 Transcript_9991/m.33924 type:complete len:267 (-) Transcript_9991:200-1000(-)
MAVQPRWRASVAVGESASQQIAVLRQAPGIVSRARRVCLCCSCGRCARGRRRKCRVGWERRWRGPPQAAVSGKHAPRGPRARTPLPRERGAASQEELLAEVSEPPQLLGVCPRAAGRRVAHEGVERGGDLREAGHLVREAHDAHLAVLAGHAAVHGRLAAVGFPFASDRRCRLAVLRDAHAEALQEDLLLLQLLHEPLVRLQHADDELLLLLVRLPEVRGRDVLRDCHRDQVEDAGGRQTSRGRARRRLGFAAAQRARVRSARPCS